MEHLRAARFCSLCHKSKDGRPPDRFSKAKADALFENKVDADYHVEMDHQAHSLRAACSTCHVVDKQSFALTRPPNHEECRGCHDSSPKPMSNCASCHETPGPSEYVITARKPSDVRVCSSAADDKRPCFKHERAEHRFRGVTPVECSDCHFMFKKKKHRGASYQSLKDIKAAPLIDNGKDLAHKNCGSAGCHQQEVDDSAGKGRCTQCHSPQFMASSLVD